MQTSWPDFVDNSGSSLSSSTSSSSFTSSSGMNLSSSGNDLSSSSSSSSSSTPPSPTPSTAQRQPTPFAPATMSSGAAFAIPAALSSAASNSSSKSSLSSSPPLPYSASSSALQHSCVNNDYYPLHQERACMAGSNDSGHQLDHPESLHDHQVKSITTLSPASLSLTSALSTGTMDPTVVMFAREWIAQLNTKMREVGSRMAGQRDQMMALTPCQSGSESGHQERLYYMQNQLNQQWKEIEQLQRFCFENEMKFSSWKCDPTV